MSRTGRGNNWHIGPVDGSVVEWPRRPRLMGAGQRSARYSWRSVLEEVEVQPIRTRVKVIYLGPVAPHWEVRLVSGDRKVFEEFRQRLQSRLLMLPPHDPQFRRNRERVVRDAEREGVGCEWELGSADDVLEA